MKNYLYKISNKYIVGQILIFQPDFALKIFESFDVCPSLSRQKLAARSEGNVPCQPELFTEVKPLVPQMDNNAE